eukprot:52416-Eustigmatos_ZCMA.PRE.1
MLCPERQRFKPGLTQDPTQRPHTPIDNIKRQERPCRSGTVLARTLASSWRRGQSGQSGHPAISSTSD